MEKKCKIRHDDPGQCTLKEKNEKCAVFFLNAFIYEPVFDESDLLNIGDKMYDKLISIFHENLKNSDEYLDFEDRIVEGLVKMEIEDVKQHLYFLSDHKYEHFLPAEKLFIATEDLELCKFLVEKYHHLFDDYCKEWIEECENPEKMKIFTGK